MLAIDTLCSNTRKTDDGIHISHHPTPAVKSGEVLIKVHTAGINRPDIMQRKGLYPPPAGASKIPGLEVASTIAALGDKQSCFTNL